MLAARHLAVPPILLALALTGCGGDSAESAGGGGQQQGGQQQDRPRGGGMFGRVTDEQRACIEKEGVELPETPPGGSGERPQRQPPQGGDGQGAPPQREGTRTAPDGRRPGGGGQFQKLREAMEACGVEMPERPQGGQNGGGMQSAPQAKGTSTASRS